MLYFANKYVGEILYSRGSFSTSQVSLHHFDVRFPTPLYMGLAGLLHRLLGLEGGQVEEVVEHLLELGQVLGVGEEAGLEIEGELCDHSLN